jgi:hypothetical protein
MKPLSRRTLLRGAGVSLALPWLEAMAPAANAATPKLPVRLAVLYMPNGVNEKAWAPEGSGANFRLSPTLQPLAPFKDRIIVTQNLWNAAAKDGDGHYVKESSILTSTRIGKTLGDDINCHGVSMDQVAAQRAGAATPIPSLELGIAPEATGVDTNVGYTRLYASHIAWSGPATPLAREINPRSVYERLFHAADPQEKTAASDALLLDRVLEDSRGLSATLGQADRHRIDEYIAIVRYLEERTQRASAKSRRSWKRRMQLSSVIPPLAEEPKEYADHVRLMLDMIALSFQSDTTVSNVNFRFLDGVTGAHHDMSHHSNDPDKLRQYQLINQWHVAQYAYLLNKLREAKEGETNVLDQSAIVFASALSDGNGHNPENLPIVVAGRAGGRLETGKSLVCMHDTPLANLWMALLTAFGTPVDRFADSTGPLPGVLT